MRGGACLLYHGVMRRAHVPAAPWLTGMPHAAFERQIRWLRAHFQIVPASSLRDRARSSSRRCLAITFDDGFANFYDNAYPVLSRYRVPVTVFVTAGFVAGAPLWFSRLQVACLFGADEPLWFRGVAHPRRTWLDRARSLETLHSKLLCDRDWAAPCAWLAALPDPHSLLEPPAARELLDGLSPAELQALAKDPLIEIGSHSHSHPMLSRCSPSQVEAELSASKQALEAIVQRPVTAFAYPYGDYDARVVDAVRRHYAHAWANAPRLEEPDAAYEQERFGVYRPSLLRLAVKASPLARLARRAGLEVG